MKKLIKLILFTSIGISGLSCGSSKENPFKFTVSGGVPATLIPAKTQSCAEYAAGSIDGRSVGEKFFNIFMRIRVSYIQYVVTSHQRLFCFFR